MAIIKCKMCGGDIELAADKTFGTCEYCGSTMTFPKIDDEQRAAAFNRGNHFRRIGEFDKALAVYERIVREDDTDAEAHWCCALCRFGIEYVEDPATYEYVPTCHRASFDSFLEDVDYLAAIEHSEGVTKRQYQKDGAKIADVQRGILATSQNEEPFDVFICYKESDENGERTRDSLMAQDVYYQLTDQGYRVFFARITLEDVAGKQYEPYIFAALNSAKVMIAIGTKAEYMNAVWVKNEWSRFLAMMKKDRNKILLPCYKDMDPYDMPEQLSVLQSYDMSKIGFIQDLIRGIKKVLDADKKTESVVETVVVQQPTNNNVIALLKRGSLALEDGEWDKADQFYEEVLNQDAECVDAYIGKTLLTFHLQKIEQLCNTKGVFENDPSFLKAMRFAGEDQQQKLKKLMDEHYQYLLESAADALKAGDWKNASQLFDGILKLDNKCVRALIGKVLALEQVTNLKGLAGKHIAQNEAAQTEIIVMDDFVEIEELASLEQQRLDQIEAAVAQYVLPGYLTASDIRKMFEIKTLTYRSETACRKQQLADEKAYWANSKGLNTALEYADPQECMQIESARALAISTAEQRLQEAIAKDDNNKRDIPAAVELQIEEAEHTAKKAYEAAIMKQERDYHHQYEVASKMLQTAETQEDFRKTKVAFAAMANYRDSMEKARECHRREEELKAAQEKLKIEQEQVAQWRSDGRCQYCGGEFKGFIIRKCVLCGKHEDY